jgi:hypothetical protein
MTYFQRKEANRYFWRVKGHLIPEGWSDDQVMAVYDSYFKRLWGNNESYQHEIGFEAAWAQRSAEQISRSK